MLTDTHMHAHTHTHIHTHTHTHCVFLRGISAFWAGGFLQKLVDIFRGETFTCLQLKGKPHPFTMVLCFISEGCQHLVRLGEYDRW